MGCGTGKLRIVVLCGSLRVASSNMAIVRYLLSLPQTSYHIELQNIGSLPLYNQDLENEDKIPTSVNDLRERVRYADGIIFSTPQYNGSVSGALKNAFDWLSRDFSAINGKTSDKAVSPIAGKKCGIISASYVSQRQITDLHNMGQYTKLQYAPKDYYVSLAQKGLFEDNELKSQAQKEKLQKWLADFVAFLTTQQAPVPEKK